MTLPMYPAPPVTRTRRVTTGGGLHPEQAPQRFEEAVTATFFGRRLQSHRGLMEELVHERLTELLDVGAILGRECPQLPQCALQLGRAQRFHAAAELFDRRDDAEAAVPGPEEIGLLLDDSLGGRNLIAPARGGLRRYRLQS